MYVTLAVSQEMKSKLEECKEEFLRHHPDMKALHISFNKILYEICEFYLKNP